MFQDFTLNIKYITKMLYRAQVMHVYITCYIMVIQVSMTFIIGCKYKVVTKQC